jgi:hypothetical protein
MNANCDRCNKRGKVGNDLRTYVITDSLNENKEHEELMCYPCFRVHQRTMQVTHKIRDKNDDRTTD